MATLTKKDQQWLREKFGPRANFDPTERILYGHDIAAMPKLIKPLVGNTAPHAIVQPKNEEELQALVAWASSKKIPLVPRGKGSSGYGGIIPTRKGIVIDFYRMKEVLAVDAAAETVSVQPGITWEQLDKKINPQGLSVRLYPTSYPSSSVGGWLAQGGAGIGSYQYGWFSDNVVSARIVLPSGEAKEVSGKDLEIVSDAEGITGIISQVKLRVQKVEDLGLTAIACPDAHMLPDVVPLVVPKMIAYLRGRA
ncbi:MAG: FAD-binding oxidoreductase [Candidatus Aminicenantes bacterium]|nr:FAD-binding oxidoreductase [Candidatus Aminicenantes bacterium]